MAIDYETLINLRIPDVEQQLTKRDTMLYALGVGLGADPCDEDELKFVYEQNLVAQSLFLRAGYKLRGYYETIFLERDRA